MYDGLKIGIGLAAFVLLITLPTWYSIAGNADAAAPELVPPIRGDHCVESTEFMRSSHMQLLNEWRDQAIRQGVRSYRSRSGEIYRISLTRTCLDCHRDRAGFCNRCHDYVGVRPVCWECHVEPTGVEP
jgi:hypothetical protein